MEAQHVPLLRLVVGRQLSRLARQGCFMTIKRASQEALTCIDLERLHNSFDANALIIPRLHRLWSRPELGDQPCSFARPRREPLPYYARIRCGMWGSPSPAVWLDNLEPQTL